MTNGHIPDPEVERRLEELRERIVKMAPGKKPQKQADLSWISYIAAAIVFVALLILRDFVNYPVQASLLALAGAAVTFFVLSMIFWIIRKIQAR